MDLIVSNPEVGHALIGWCFALLGVGASALAAWFLVKLGITLSDRQKQTLNEAIDASLRWVEEQAHKGLDKKGEEKLKMAENVARSLAPKSLRSVSAAQFAILAEAKLQSMRPWLPRTQNSLAPLSIPPAPLVPSILTPVPPKKRAPS